MASSKEYLCYILDQMSELNDITYKSMMGEYILYYNGVIIGGIYDNRLLVKPLNEVVELMNDVKYELPYVGGKPMILVEEVDDKDFLKKLITTMYTEIISK